MELPSLGGVTKCKTWMAEGYTPFMMVIWVGRLK